MWRAVPLALVVALALAGCGDLSRGELERRVTTLESLAAEGQLLAGEVARDRTKATFARVRARELAEDADHEAEKMADATPSDGLADVRDDAVEQAQALADAFGTLQVFPGAEDRAAQVEQMLEKHGAQLSKLAERL
jgi:hypothetical protein